jgi:hypothetical protein
MEISKKNLLEFECSSFKITLNPSKGTWNLYSMLSPRCVIKNASIGIFHGKESSISLNRSFSTTSTHYVGNLGEGTRYRLDFMVEAGDPYHMQLDMILYPDLNLLTLEGLYTNISGKDQFVSSAAALITNKKQEGGVFIADSPDAAAIFENGLTMAMEFVLRGLTAREESESVWMQFIYSKPDLKENLLIGIIDKPKNIAEILSNEDEAEGLVLDGREGLAEYQVQTAFPRPKLFLAGDTISSGVWAVMVDVRTGFQALETYADLVHRYNQIRIWPHAIPHGWNSWCNPIDGYPGTAYSTNINEEIILANLKVAAKELKPFGLEYFQIDNGYSPDHLMTVDEVAEDRFPHGMKWLADQIHAEGLKAGLWINPFNVGKNSKYVTQFKKDGWFPERDPTFPVQSGWLHLDLSIPAVQNYIRHVIRKVVHEWGYDILKIDFTYMVMAAKKYANPEMTAAEIQRLGYEIIRDEAGPNVFIFGIGGPIGLHLGAVDAERISLDTLPFWKSDNSGLFANGLLPSYLTFARRYFYHNRIFINHLDCLSFRASFHRHESMCLATAIGLLGGMWKIGDKIIDLKPEDIAVCRRLLPIYRTSARPLDLFRHSYPEILDLYVEKAFGDWHVVGLFNWGENMNILTGESDKDSPKEIQLIFKEMGLSPHKEYHLFDFWEQKYLGIHKTSYQKLLQPHHSQTISVHEVKNIPQLISSNRHISQGGIELDNVEWDETKCQLKCVMEAVPGFDHTLTFIIPPPYTMINVTILTSEHITSAWMENCLQLLFRIPSSAANGKVEILLEFEKKGI